MVQAGIIILYVLYISMLACIIFRYYKKTKQLKAMNDSFLMAIHDIKNYSVNIDASGQILKAIAENEEKGTSCDVLSKHLEVINKNCREMNGLIENYSKIIKHWEKPGSDDTEEDIAELVEEAVILNNHYAKKKNIDVKIETKWQGKLLKLDREKVIRILNNIIMNGIKYSYDGGKVLVSMHSEDDWLDISVIDDGKGMSHYELERAFDKHYRAGRDGDIAELSLGIGLYASRHLAVELGGTLWAESTEGKGSRFILRLPVNRAAKSIKAKQLFNFSMASKKTSV
ncbi:sensor histidine kinase [Lutispora saccharofermentans]|uniref:histidine kinase n=1 Tax=Lutispora saccharofermentans TaxID=3024236 RepID=A0ABT1NAD3_9FIRM|nr:HAMP domain-containing sensor histidine kinase [Lutispora saccharofermentans]MCQ1528209.1 HAMP domain-containing histidine kinase [Lutispora saccharofermentans]